MTGNEKKDILRIYRRRRAQVEELEDRIEDLRATVTAKSAVYDGTPRARGHRDLSDWAVKNEKLEQRLHEAVALEYDALRTIEVAAAKLEDPLMRHVIRAHYIELKDVPTIARECGRSEHCIWVYHRRAIALLDFAQERR